MIVPSIDILGGHAVQLVGGQDLKIDAGDPAPLLERFRPVGEVAVIDLDAALGRGSNHAQIRALCARAACRVGGGIRSVASALDWLDAGASQIILGTAATPEVLRQLPRERVIAALDAVHGEVVIDGWRTRTGARIIEQMHHLRPHVGGFLVTFVEREGRMGGTDLEQVPALRDAAGDARLTIAGGVTTPEEIAALDRLGVDAQVGMALYSGQLHLADALAAPLRSDRPDGLWPTIVSDEGGTVLGLVYSSAESLRVALDERRGVYASRRRGLWRKGETSGDTQELLRIALDCDRDTLHFTVRQAGRGFCHTGTPTCFGLPRGLRALEAMIQGRQAEAPAGSYTARLFTEPGLLAAKLREEGDELAAAITDPASDRAAVIHEAADVLYFTLAALAQSGASLADVEAELDRRSRRVRRRRGDAKPPPAAAALPPAPPSETDR